MKKYEGKNFDQITLAIVIACHNRREHTLSSIRALSQQSIINRLSFEVYLLDDGSTDGTSHAVRTEFPYVHILEGDGTLFWTRGMHKSFAAAIQKGFDFYLWLNDDSILYANALEVLLKTHASVMRQGEECAIIGGAMQHPTSGKFTYGGIKRHKSRIGTIKLKRIAPNNKAIRCDATNGNCVLIPESVVRKVGNLDPIYLHVGGDHDYCFRALQKGCSVWLSPGYLGTCVDNPIEGSWMDASLPVMERIHKLHSPFGLPFYVRAIYLKRHHGLWWPAQLIWPYIKIVVQSILGRPHIR
jgi:GT2 family glycosyltransferase